MTAFRGIRKSFVARAGLLFVLLALPWPGLASLYTGFLAGMANVVVGSDGPPVRLTCGRDDSAPWDMRVRAEETETGRFIEAAVTARTTGYLPTAVFVALSLALPIRGARKARLAAGGAAGLQLVPLLPILSDFSGSLPIVAFHFAPPVRFVVILLEHVLLGPPGMAFATPALLWLALVWKLDPEILYGGAAEER